MKTAHRFLLYGIPKSLLFKIILFLIILLFGKNVFAQEFTVSSSNITSPNSGGTGKYTGTEIYNTGTANVYNMNTRYNGRLSRIVFNLSPGGYAETTSNFDLGKTYTLTMNMATDDWRNNFGSVSVKCNGSSGTELSNGRVNYISYRKINFSFSTGSNTCGFVYVDLKSKNIVSTAFTGVSNWNLSSMVITDPTYCSGSDCYTPPSGGSSGSTNQDIINSNNQNTQDIITNDDKNTNNIINNNTNNTNNIIDNANQNTQDIINNQQELLGNCTIEQYSSISTVGSITSNFYYYETSDIDISQFELNKTYYWGFNLSNVNNGSYSNVFATLTVEYTDGTYSENSIYSTTHNGSYRSSGFQFTKPISWARFRFLRTATNTGSTKSGTFTNIYITTLSSPPTDYSYLYKNCKSKLDDTNSAINNVNDSINNSNVDTGTGSDFFNDFQSQDNGGISGIITKPLVLINSLLSNNNSCSNLSFGIQFPGLDSKTVSFPSGCILWNNVPSTVVNIYQVFVVGFCSYYLLKRLFKDVEDLKNPEKDNVEVIDL